MTRKRIEYKKSVFSIILTSSSAILGIIIISFGPMIVDYIASTQLQFKSSSACYKEWKHVGVPMKTQFYFFNWTNPEDISKPGIKPQFQELGPYTYTTTIDKENIFWNENNGTISYQENIKWFLDEDESNSVTDRITSINPIALSSAHVTRHWSYLLRKGISFTLSASTSKIYSTNTVTELLFDGYDDTLLNIARNLPYLKEMPKLEKFAWFRLKNGSRDYNGYFNVGTGEKGTKLGQMYSWNYKSVLPYLASECSQLKSLTGQLPYKNPNNNYTIFYSDFCRDMYFDYHEDIHVSNILGTVHLHNSCFCNGGCLPSGVINLTSCSWGSPTFGSLPHFLDADPYYTNSIEGMNPNSAKHQFEYVLEPIYGLPLKVSARFQLNSLVQSYQDISLFKNVPKFMMPILWAELIIELPDFYIFLLKIILNSHKICYIFGGSLLCFAIVWMLFRIRKADGLEEIEEWTDLDETARLREKNPRLPGVNSKHYLFR